MEKLLVDNDICIGCGFCCASKPDVFDMNDEDRAYVVEENINEDDKEDILDIVEGCPVGAIKVEQKDIEE